MATELSSFAELKKAPVIAGVPDRWPRIREKEIDAQGRAYATGRRKNAVARVWVKLGTGKITVNGRDQKVYFARPTQQMVIQQPFDVSQRNGQFDVDRHRLRRRPVGPGRRGAPRHRPGAVEVRARPARRDEDPAAS